MRNSPLCQVVLLVAIGTMLTGVTSSLGSLELGSPPPRSTSFPASFFTGPAGRNVVLPAKRGVLLGVAQSGSRGAVREQLASLEGSIGRRLDIEHVYMQHTCNIDLLLIKRIAARGSIPMVSWGPMPNNGGRILDGEADACIKRVGKQIGSQRHRILLRFYWEFNGDWFPWARSVEGGLLSSDQQRALWRRTVDQLRAGGAFARASAVWCPGEGHYGNGDTMDESVAYPGDRYVDWVCSDGYNVNRSDAWCGSHAGWCEFSEIFTHGRLSRGVEATFRGRKPYMVGETASVEGGPDQKRDWLTNARDYVKSSMPGMLALVYFDVNYVDGDWRISTSPSALAGFRSLALDPYFNPGGRTSAPAELSPTSLKR